MDHVVAEECWEADEVEGVERGRGDAPSIDEVVEKADESLISVALQAATPALVRWQRLRLVPAGNASRVPHR